ncbi:MAG: protein kinase, partial [Planctomycetota bacterium]
LIRGQGLDAIIVELSRLRTEWSGQSGMSSKQQASIDDSELVDRRTIASAVHSGDFAAERLLDTSPSPADAKTIQLRRASPSEASGSDSTVSLSGSTATGTTQSGRREFHRSAARIGQQAAEALAYSHSRGTVHRDIKPSNLLLDAAGVVWVTDFGLAQTEEQDLTRTGDIVGTVRYMSPERFHGDCDERADIYALGLTIYELLVLRPAFQSSSRAALIEEILHRQPQSPRSIDSRIPIDLETIVLRAIDKEPQRRYATAQELAEDLARFLRDEPISARRVSDLERAWRWSRRNPGLATSIFTLVVLAVGITVISTIVAARFREERETQKTLAADKVRLASEREREAVRANEGWKLADSRRAEMQRHLYAAEMYLASDAANRPGGIQRVDELTEAWRPERTDADLRGWEWFYLKALCDRELETLTDTHSPHDAQCLSWSPDSKELLVGFNWGSVHIWSLSETKGIRLRLHEYELNQWHRVEGVAWNPQRPIVAVVFDGTLSIQRAIDGAVLSRPFVQRGIRSSYPEDIRWSRDGKRLAMAAAEGVFVVEGAQLDQVGLIGKHERNTLSVDWSPDGKRIASCGADGRVRVWNAETIAGSTTKPPDKNQPEVEFERSVTLHSLAWHPEKPYLIAGSALGEVILWDVDLKKLILERDAHESLINQVRWSPDGKQFGVASRDRTASIWDLSIGRKRRVLSGHTHYVTDISWSPDGTRIATSSEDSSIKFWDANPERENRPLDGPQNTVVRYFEWSPDGKKIATGDNAGAIRVWNAENGKHLVDLGVQHEYHALSVSWSPDGRRLVSTGGGTRINVFDSESGKRLYELKDSKNRSHSARFSPDGKLLATTSDDKKLRIWDLSTRERILLADVGESLRTVDFRYDGHRVVVADVTGGVSIYEVENGKRLRRLEANRDAVLVARWSPDGRWIASAGVDARISIWNVEAGGPPVRVLRGHNAVVRGLSWSPDGERIASGGDDRLIKVWNAKRQAEPRTIRDHVSMVTCVAWNSDGTQLASSSGDGTLRIWDARVGYEQK